MSSVAKNSIYLFLEINLEILNFCLRFGRDLFLGGMGRNQTMRVISALDVKFKHNSSDSI
jgi:hypothetical protein